VLAFARATGAREYLHPNLASKAVSIRRLATMPAYVEIAKSGVKGNARNMKESQAVEDKINGVVKKVLSSRGFAVLDDSARQPDTSGSDDGVDAKRAAFAMLQSRFDILVPQLLTNPKDVTKGRYSMGGDVADMAPKGADAIVFVRGACVVTTASQPPLTRSSARSELYCAVTVVDAGTGDVLFVSSVERAPLSHDIVVAAAALERPMTKAFAKLPLGR
jgi:hypothetical protein